jgi:hydroxymethylglutaryl-CoA lyase
VSLEATPDHDDRGARLWEACADRIGPDRLALRLQGRREASLAAIRSLLPLGLQTLDTALGGLDGTTVATEDVVQLLAELGIATWVDPDRLLETTWWLSAHLARS